MSDSNVQQQFQIIRQAPSQHEIEQSVNSDQQWIMFNNQNVSFIPQPVTAMAYENFNTIVKTETRGENLRAKDLNHRSNDENTEPSGSQASSRSLKRKSSTDEPEPVANNLEPSGEEEETNTEEIGSNEFNNDTLNKENTVRQKRAVCDCVNCIE